MDTSIKVIFDGDEYDAVAWTGTNIPFPEEFKDLGFFEDYKGYDLSSVDTDYALEPGRKKGYIRQDDWILKNKDGKFSNVSAYFFRANFKKLKG